MILTLILVIALNSNDPLVMIFNLTLRLGQARSLLASAVHVVSAPQIAKAAIHGNYGMLLAQIGNLVEGEVSL